MKFNFFSVLFHKSQRGLNSLISTKDKIEEIRYQYNKNAERYIKSAEDLMFLRILILLFILFRI